MCGVASTGSVLALCQVPSIQLGLDDSSPASPSINYLSIYVDSYSRENVAQ